MIYSDYLTTSEMERWILETDIPWKDIDPEKARECTDILDRVRDSALIESFFPIFTPRALEVLWDDVDATSVFSVQLYESYKHFHVFNQYLNRIDYKPIPDEEIVELRKKNRDLSYDDGVHLLTRYMMSEHFAAYHFFKDARQSPEPVLEKILKLVSQDEVRHSKFAYDLLDQRVEEEPSVRETIFEAAKQFRHIGLEIISDVPQAQEYDFSAILSVNQKIERLTGKSLETEVMNWGETASDDEQET